MSTRTEDVAGPYRSAPLRLPHPPPRTPWLVALWRRWKYRRCWRGDHDHVFEMRHNFAVNLRCERCGMVRELVGYGPLAFRATSDWRTP